MAAAQKLSPAVYRRRRVAAVLLVLAVIAVFVLVIGWLTGLARGGAGAPGSSQAPTVTAAGTEAGASTAAQTTTTAEPATPQPVNTGPAVCTAAEVSLTAVTDAESYGPGQLPKLSMRFVNKSASECAMDIGTSTQVYTVKSGDDTIWVSTHCQTDQTSQVVLLQPGKEVTSPPIEWVRERSNPDTCDSDSRPAAVAGGAYYSLTVSVGGLTSAPTYFVLE